MSVDDLYRTVMAVDPPAAETPFDAATRQHLFGEIWNRPGLSIRDRRLVTLACVVLYFTYLIASYRGFPNVLVIMAVLSPTLTLIALAAGPALWFISVASRRRLFPSARGSAAAIDWSSRRLPRPASGECRAKRYKCNDPPAIAALPAPARSSAPEFR